MGRVFARQMRNTWFKIAQYQDETGRRRQRSLGPITELEAERLVDQGGEQMLDSEVERLIGARKGIGDAGDGDRQGGSREGDDEQHSEAQDGANSDQIDPELAALYRRAMRDFDRVFSALYPRFPEYAGRFHEVVRAIRAGDAVMIELFPGIHNVQ